MKDGGFEGVRIRSSCLDTDAGLAPVPPLGVVSVRTVLVMLFLRHHASGWNSTKWRGCYAPEGGSYVPDGVTSPQSDPLRDRSVLLLGFRQLLLRPEGLVALWK